MKRVLAILLTAVLMLTVLPVSAEKETIECANHNYSDEWTVDVEPTCTEPGSQSHHCTVCGVKSDMTETIPATGCDWVLERHEEASCAETGGDIYVCQNNETHIKQIVGANGYIHFSGLETTPAPYSKWILADGLSNRNSGYDLQTNFPDRENVYLRIIMSSQTWTPITVRLRSRDLANKEGDPCPDNTEHNCGWVVTSEDVTIEGETMEIVIPLNREPTNCRGLMDWSQVNLIQIESRATTTVLDAKIVVGNADEVFSHSYSEWTVDKAPTQTTRGSEIRICDCGDKEQRPIPSLGVDGIGDLRIEVGDGVVLSIRNDASLSGQIIGGIPNETIVEIYEIRDNWGYIAYQDVEGWICLDYTVRVCDHNYATEWTVDAEPTCTEVGGKSHHCLVCGDKTDITEIPAIGHDWKLLGHEDATCTEDGYNLYGCKSDATHTMWETIEFSGHDYSTEWTVDIEPTCTEVGSKSHHCANCEDKADLTEIPMLDHSFGEWTEEKAPTLTEEGSEVRSCTECEAEERRAIPVLECEYGDVDGTTGVTAADALLALQAATGKINLDEAAAKAADVDGKEGVTANDALLILQYATKKIAAFPVAG